MNSTTKSTNCSCGLEKRIENRIKELESEEEIKKYRGWLREELIEEFRKLLEKSKKE